jgi:hypothetical protein
VPVNIPPVSEPAIVDGGIRHQRSNIRLGVVVVAGYIGTIFAANWAIERYGPVPVGFGYEAPAGVWFAGLAFTFRDLTQETLGRRWVVAAIVVGAALSGLVSTDFAVASATAFLVSELADFAVYTPLAERGWLRAVIASNAVGLVVDSVLFLWLAFDSLDFLPGQVIGKAWMTALAVVLLSPTARRRALRPSASPSPR